MSTNPEKDQQVRDDSTGLSALELQARVAEAYADFVNATPEMESVAGHYVVFALAARELAIGGATMDDLIRTIGRQFGVVFESLEIVDESAVAAGTTVQACIDLPTPSQRVA